VPPQNGKPDVPQHLMIENAALGAADKNRCALVGNVAAAILKALETYAIENILQIGDLLRRQLRANPFKSCIRQGSSS
jgi:seryl-tRNA(Sec) selenium transferase